jgi:hypothetical protein
MKMTSNGKTLNYKVVDFVESYNVHIKFTSIRIQIKIFFLKTDGTLTAAAPTAGATVPCAPLTPWGTAVGPCRQFK